MLPLAVGSFVASGVVARLAGRRGPIAAVRLGVAMELVGVVSLGAVIGVHTSWWATVVPLFVYGAGVGSATAQLTGVILADVPVAQSGQGSGTQSTTRQLGSALGIAILGTVLFATLGAGLSSQLSGLDGIAAAQQTTIVSAVKQSAGAAIRGLAANPQTAQAAVAAREAFANATRWVAFTAAAFLALGLLATRSLGQRQRTRPDGAVRST